MKLISKIVMTALIVLSTFAFNLGGQFDKGFLSSSKAYADVIKALPQNASNIELEYAPVYDYDKDGCYATAAISPDGTTNPGLSMSGSTSSGCRDLSRLQNSNTYSRAKSNNGWTAIMYTSYFEKDQAVAGSGLFGHRHDWEHVIVWVKDGQVEYVSYSAHGNFYTNHRSNVRFEGKHPKIVYHKDGGLTHAFRLAQSHDEPPENHYQQWLHLPLVGWDGYPSLAIRDKLVTTDFGKANVGIKPGDFEDKLKSAKPAGINFDAYALENNGVYRLVSKLNNSSVIDLNQSTNNVALWSNNNGNNQKWKLVYDSNKSAYQIKSIANENLVLTWDYNSSINKDNVIATSNSYGNGQYWIPEPTSDGYFYLKSMANPAGVLDVSGSNTNNGTNIVVWTKKDQNNQKFKLEKLN
ncbi:NPP1 family protein [Bacillus pacificus]|nr:NPP1 family protein [Bacillus thuringiensis]MED1305302.1 NPP1 family protein [Bacillus pacificus]